MKAETVKAEGRSYQASLARRQVHYEDAARLRRGLVANAPEVELTGEVEIDEAYVVAGHKGQPAAVAKRAGSGAGAGWRARRAAARWRGTSRRSSG